MVCSVCEDLAIDLAMPIAYFSYSYKAMNTLLHCNYHHSYVCLNKNHCSSYVLANILRNAVLKIQSEKTNLTLVLALLILLNRTIANWLLS